MGALVADVELDERGSIAALVAGVEQPGRPAVFGPRADGREGCLVDMAAQHDVRLVLIEQALSLIHI